MSAIKRTIVRIYLVTLRTLGFLSPRLAARSLERIFLRTRRRARPEREQTWLASARRTELTGPDGNTIPVWTWGDGPVILLAHGWDGRGSQLGAFAQALVARGYRVVAWDGPGHGEAAGERSSIIELAETLELVADWAGPVDGLVAHSLGAAAATFAIGRGLKVGRAVYLAPPENPGQFLELVARHLHLDDSVVRTTQRRIESRFGFRWNDLRGAEVAPSLRVPLLVLHDFADPQVAWREGARLVALWPDADLITTRGLGHYRILRDPAVVAAATHFLAGHDAVVPFVPLTLDLEAPREASYAWGAAA